MTKVIANFRTAVFAAAWLGWGIATFAWGQDAASSTQAAPATQKSSGPAESLYFQLSNVGLDESRVYRIREARLDRSAIHITFEDGTIGFTKDVAGKITGAFFEGDAELLLQPPYRVERASLALFTGAAILEERFATAYFRFNDDTFAELQPLLRPADNGREFVTEFDQTARNLAGNDALRLLITFSRALPEAGEKASAAADQMAITDDRLFHARVQGLKLGTFDLAFDSRAAEQIWAGQAKTVAGGVYYDTWTAFSTLPKQKKDREGEQDLPEAITVPRYRIRTEIMLPKSISGNARVEIEAHRSGERTLLFELSRFLQLESVEADGHPIEFIHNPAIEGTQLARSGNDVMAVVLPRPLRAGQHLELTFTYHGDVLSDAGGGLLYVGARGTWFPNRNFAMSNFDLEFRYPAGWTLVATGKRAEAPQKEAAPPGEQISRWVTERPIPVAGFNLGKYRRAFARAGKVTVETYASAGVEESFPKPSPQFVNPAARPEMRLPPQAFAAETLAPSPAQNAQAVADTSARAVELFSRYYGPFPYAGLALTQNPGTLSQGWPGLVFLSSYAFLRDDDRAQLHMSPVQRALSNQVVAHETAHQWWGDLVAWRSYRDQWMMEALANYSSLMLLESSDPRQFQAVMEQYRDDLLAKNQRGESTMQAGPVTLGGRLSNSHFPEGYEAISYGRGTWLLHMLRSMMRDAEVRTGRAASGLEPDEPFLRALRRLREQNEEREISTPDFLHALEEELPRPLWHEGHKSLDWFYDGWINGTAIPHFELHNLKYAETATGVVVSGSISQKEGPEDLVTPVPLYAVVAGKNLFLGRVFVDGPEASFRLKAPRGARKVVLDPNHTVLARR